MIKVTEALLKFLQEQMIDPKAVSLIIHIDNAPDAQKFELAVRETLQSVNLQPSATQMHTGFRLNEITVQVDSPLHKNT